MHNTNLFDILGIGITTGTTTEQCRVYKNHIGTVRLVEDHAKSNCHNGWDLYDPIFLLPFSVCHCII